MRKTFDDIIRRRWEGQQFPVDDNHRQQMLGLLEGKKKRRAFAFWWWGAGAVVLVAAYLLWQTSADPSQPQPAQPHAATAIENANGVSVESIHSHTVDPTTNNAVTEATPGNANTSDVQTNSKAVEGALSSENNNRTSTTKQSAKSSATKSSNSPVKGVDRNKNKQQGFTLQQSTPHSTLSSVIVTETVLAGDKNDHDPSGEPVSADENIALTVTAISESATTSPEIVSETPQPARLMLNIAWLDALPIEELMINTDHPVGLIAPASTTRHPMYAFAEGGVGAILGAKTKYPSGWKVNAGAGIGYRVQPKLHLMLSGGYLMQDGGFDFERTSTVSSLGFAARSQINSLKPDRLHYVYGKLGLHYRIKKHHIGGSIEAQWLYGAQGVINIHTNDGLSGSSESSRYAWLSLNGLNRWQYNAGVQYGYRLTPHLNIAAGTQCYFTSLTRQDPALQAEGYSWKGNTARVQPFITFNYLLYGPF